VVVVVVQTLDQLSVFLAINTLTILHGVFQDGELPCIQNQEHILLLNALPLLFLKRVDGVIQLVTLVECGLQFFVDVALVGHQLFLLVYFDLLFPSQLAFLLPQLVEFVLVL